jgi:hypothetical protein
MAELLLNIEKKSGDFAHLQRKQTFEADRYLDGACFKPRGGTKIQRRMQNFCL